MNFKQSASIILMVTVISGCKTGNGNDVVLPNKIEIRGDTAHLGVGQSVNYRATGVYENRTEDLTSIVSWHADGSAITVTEGEVKGETSGISLLTASLSELKSDPIDITVTDYSVHESQVISIEPIIRGVSEGFDLDDVYFQATNNGLYIVNNTPRTIGDMLYQINDDIFKNMFVLEPFTRYLIQYPANHDYNTVLAIRFLDKAPLFRANVTYFQESDDITYGAPTEAEIVNYTKEMLSQKKFANEYDLNLFFLQYQHGLLPNFARYVRSHDHENCGYVATRSSTVTSTVNDDSNISSKLVSLRAHKPSSYYRMFVGDDEPGVVGRATIGDGWLSIRSSRLKYGSDSIPTSTYEHEKLHNHGFGHSGNMTYGWSDEFPKYLQENGIDFYAESEGLEKTHAIVSAEQKLIEDGNVLVTLSWISDAVGGSKEKITDLLLSVAGEVEILEGGMVTLDDSRYPITESLEFDNSTTKVWSGSLDIDVVGVNSMNNGYVDGELNRFYFIYTQPDSNSSATFIVSSKNAVGGQSYNAYFSDDKALGVTDTSFASKSKAFVFNGYVKGEDGKFTEEAKLFTPSEAADVCKTNGMQLGILHPYKSDQMMDFQSRHNKYGSQVGRAFESGEPIAVNVPTTYAPSKISQVDKGNVILCSG